MCVHNAACEKVQPSHLDVGTHTYTHTHIQTTCEHTLTAITIPCFLVNRLTKDATEREVLLSSLAVGKLYWHC